MSFSAFQDDVIIRLRQLDNVYRYRLCGRAHVMGVAKVCGVFSCVWTVMMCIVILVLPLNKLYVVTESCVLFCAIICTGFMFVGINKRRPSYICPWVTFTSVVCIYSLMWFIVHGILHVQMAEYYWKFMSSSIVILTLWAITCVMYAYMTLIGYHLYRYLNSYRHLYHAAAMTAIASDGRQHPESQDTEDVILSLQKEHQPNTQPKNTHRLV